MRVLVLDEVHDLDVLLAGGFVSNDEAVVREGLEHFVHGVGADVVVAEDGLLQLPRPVFEAPGAVRLGP